MTTKISIFFENHNSFLKKIEKQRGFSASCFHLPVLKESSEDTSRC